MRGTIRINKGLIIAGAALGAVAGTVAALGSYVRWEKDRRGYPSWDSCQCEFKDRQTIFQVWYSRHEPRGETIISQEWGTYLTNPAPWLRRLLHYGAQVAAILNPRGRYVERVTLSAQEARRFVVLLQGAGAANDEEVVDIDQGEESGQIVWRREILHVPRRPFDPYIYRLYPAPVSAERAAQIQPLPALWEPHSNLPLATTGTVLETPPGTRIDYVGWTPSQVSYCSARLK